VPLSVLAWPDEENEGNIFEAIEIPGGLSFLSYSDSDAEVKGLKDFPPQDRPPVLISFLAFRLMVGIGTALPLIAGLAWLMRRRIAEPKLRPLRLLLAASLPLPWLAILAGWALTEVGRQPWIVYGVMRTKDAVSPIDASQAAGSLVLLFLLFSVTLIVGAFFIGRFALQGPPDADGPAFLQEGGRS
jgi:cytochrome d ubiquinol oxidase subunit I